ncbi:hypothetical protein AD998_20160 [bacterium 336/3]|nr:hypothetical protein AD998_20160 [bacterium 336/3]
MDKLHTIFLTTLVFLTSCKDKGELISNNDNYQCKTFAIQNDFSRNQLLQSFDSDILQGLASIDVPNSEGAMGRNKNGYFHVRFQVGILGQSDYAVAQQNSQALEYAIKSIEYSFDRQLPDGNFQLVVPSNLSNQTPNQADLASGVSFFLSSVGLALNNFEQSTWYNSLTMANYKNRIETLRPKIVLAANWLLAQKNILEIADQNAPNRLFFNALAFYSLGTWLKDETLKSVGISFVKLGISKKQSKGYFLEGNGWDSSYQGVALNVGFNLYSILSNNLSLKTELWDCLSCASDWQKSRILESGEISTQGNVRVYSGGESFLGEEKQVDWIKSMISMFAMGYYSNQNTYISTANKIKSFYN